VPETFNLAQYAGLSVADLKSKLAQFPEQTTLVWGGAEDPVSARQTELFEEISRFASEHHLRIVK
jgi:hypothetical protein